MRAKRILDVSHRLHDDTLLPCRQLGLYGLFLQVVAHDRLGDAAEHCQLGLYLRSVAGIMAATKLMS